MTWMKIEKKGKNMFAAIEELRLDTKTMMIR